MALKQRDLWAVFIEWDGQRPPTTWYRRLHEMAGWVRGEGNGFDKKDSPLTRRQNETGGVIVQEGCIICQSESLARTLASLAYSEAGWTLEAAGGKRPLVWVSRLQMSQVRSIDAGDAAQLAQIEKALGAKGRRPANAHYQTTCLECMEVYTQVTPRGRAFSCPNPNCGGVKVHSREGSPYNYRDDGSPIFELWKRSRFSGPHFEPVNITETGEVAPALSEIEIFSAKEDDAVLAIETSPEVLQMAETIASRDRLAAVEFLDVILAARAHYTFEQRSEARLSVISDYFAKGGAGAGLMVAESPTADLLDAALLLDHDDLIGLLFELSALAGQ
jgi:hypothetical protein